jgi:uncharacterized membrane protein YdjX (TVP38/TMEM64 family)
VEVGGPSERLPPRAAAVWRLGALVLAVAAAFAAVALLAPHSAEELRPVITGLGPLAPLAFVLVATALTCALFPYPVIAAASGLLFGTTLGTVVSIAGGAAGAVAAFLLARAGGARPVAALAGPRLRRLLARVGRHGFLAVLYLRIVPGVPRDLANYAVGLTPVGLGAYTAATVLGLGPRAFAYTALGSSFSLGRRTSPEAIAATVILVAIGLLGLVLVLRDLRRQRRE